MAWGKLMQGQLLGREGEIHLSGKTNRKFFLGYGKPPIAEYSVVDYKFVSGIYERQKFSEMLMVVCTGTWGLVCAHIVHHPYAHHVL
jgi:hypothetical protein